jgi:hypothetical protein
MPRVTNWEDIVFKVIFVLLLVVGITLVVLKIYVCIKYANMPVTEIPSWVYFWLLK